MHTALAGTLSSTPVRTSKRSLRKRCAYYEDIAPVPPAAHHTLHLQAGMHDDSCLVSTC